MPDIFTPKPAQTQPVQQTELQSAPVPSPMLQTNYAKKAIPLLPPYPTGTSLGLLSYFRMHPKGVTFENQEDDEHIVLFIRRHFITNVPWILLTIVLLVVPIIAIAFIKLSGLDLFSIPNKMVIVILAFYYLTILSYALMNFIIWFYHVGIVTQKRLLDLDVYNILSHHLAETEITEIVDVSYMQNGFFQSFFNYGDVPIQTKAIKANFEFEACPRPATVSDIITDLRPSTP